MTKDDAELSTAKRAYRNASDEGNRQEEARWANVIGDFFKNRGEYGEALRWFRVDYEVSIKYLPEKQLLPTCQSLGEVYLRLQQLNDALIYQKKHLELAKDTDDLIEQQRAATQLGRTYHEMFLKSEDDHTSLRNAKKYFISAMKLAQTLKENSQSNRYSFVKEYIDSHNNIGMVEMDLDNLEEAEKILTKGLQICDEEEVVENDDRRTRLHHNLGNVYMELRKWDKAKKHIETDIVICKNIGHSQGEAKGYINLGELHYRVQKYEVATVCYQKAMKLAKSMEDEHALTEQVDQNIEVVKEATKVMEDLKKEEQNLMKLTRDMVLARGTSGERKCLLQQNASLDRLIEKSSIICAWKKHCEFAKKKKKIASELCDKETLGDSYLVVGESYQKLRNFSKAQKWYSKSWETYKSIGYREGQALAKINFGAALDSVGQWENALDAFNQGYSMACEANLISVQLLALENMHYSYMIRFDNPEEARRLQSQIEKLKKSISDDEPLNITKDLNLSKSYGLEDFLSDDEVSFHPSKDNNTPSRSKGSQATKRSSGSTQTLTQKRARLVLSDNEDGNKQVGRHPQEHVASSNEFKSGHDVTSNVHEYQDISPAASKCAMSASSHKKLAPVTAQDLRCDAAVSENISQNIGPFFDNCHDEYCKHMIFKVEEDFVHLEPSSCKLGNKLSIQLMKDEVACLYFLKLIKENPSKGLFPIIKHLNCGGQVIDSIDALDIYMFGKCWIEVSIDCWVPKRLVKLYVDCCNDLSEPLNLKLVKKLYNLEVSEDEIVVSDCELLDISAAPLMKALHSCKTIALLNLSHNLLGYESMEKLKQVFMSITQKYGGLVLDLHSNLFGPTALFQICECPVLLARLEVLNISGNRLTDGCASYLSAILQNCKGLYSLKIERCCITSRTIQKVTDSLDSTLVLSELFIGYNTSISGIAIVNLLDKLATLNSFSLLSLNGIKLNKNAVDSLCKYVRTSSSFSGLMIGDTSIGTERAIELMDSWNSENCEMVKLDLSSCLLTSDYVIKLQTNAYWITSLVELNLGHNPLMQEGAIGLASIIKNPKCCLKVLNLTKCQLGLLGMLTILQALAHNTSLEEVNLSQNTLQHDLKLPDSLVKPTHDEVNISQHEVDTDCNDSGDDTEEPKVNTSSSRSMHGSCMSSFQISKSKSKSTEFEGLLYAVSMARRVRVLDLSGNGMSEEAGEILYGGWSTYSRGGLTKRHIDGDIIHLSVEPYQCCNLKPCC